MFCILTVLYLKVTGPEKANASLWLIAILADVFLCIIGAMALTSLPGMA